MFIVNVVLVIIIFFNIIADSTVVALVVLPYMIPDSRCSPDHEIHQGMQAKLYFIIQ